MSKRSDIDYLKDILEAAKRVTGYCKDLDYEGFLNDIKTQDAAVRNIEIIGEAAKNISPSYRELYPDIPWKNISGMRDKLIHGYFGVNLDIVWEVIKNDLPMLVGGIEAIITQIDK